MNLDEAEQLVAEAIVDFGDHIVTARAAQPLREAWVALGYGRVVGATRVAISDAPDCELSFADGRKEFWEITEVMERGRKRTAEYKTDRTRPVFDNWKKRVEDFIPALKKRSDAKSRKVYPPNTSLLIYANMGTYGWFREAIEPQLHDATQSAGQVFRCVAMLWEERAYTLWQGGARLPMEPIQMLERNACQ